MYATEPKENRQKTVTKNITNILCAILREICECELFMNIGS